MISSPALPDGTRRASELRKLPSLECARVLQEAAARAEAEDRGSNYTDWEPSFATLPWFVHVPAPLATGLIKDSGADVIQVKSISENRLLRRIGVVRADPMDEIAASDQNRIALEEAKMIAFPDALERSPKSNSRHRKGLEGHAPWKRCEPYFRVD